MVRAASIPAPQVLSPSTPASSEVSSAPLDAKAMGAGTDMSLLTLAEMAPDMALMDPSPKPAMPAKPKADAAAPILRAIRSRRSRTR
jgi:hypothetical protein